jgi:iron(III) transport system substrate-binding protein
MKKLAHFLVVALIVTVILPINSIFAQKSLPQVPITYPGDTDKTIARRAQWIEGAKKEGTVVWWGSIPPAQLTRLASEFNKIYPFIIINFWRGQDKERQTRIEAEHSISRVTADFCDSGGDENYPRWRKIGLVDTYTDIIPGIEKRDKRSYSKYGDWAQLGNNAAPPLYNTKLVSAAEAPKSWEDLLNPKWKGHIGLTTDVRAWYTLAVGEGGWGVGKTEDFLKKIKLQEPIWTQGHSAGNSLMVAGEFKIMGENNLRYAFEAQEKGAPVDWVRVRPVPITGGSFFMVKKAPHPNAVRLFVEWLFSPQGMAVYEKITGYGPAFSGSGSRLSKALEGLSLVYKTEEVMLKAIDLSLIDRFANILGVTPE